MLSVKTKDQTKLKITDAQLSHWSTFASIFDEAREAERRPESGARRRARAPVAPTARPACHEYSRLQAPSTKELLWQAPIHALAPTERGRVVDPALVLHRVL